MPSPPSSEPDPSVPESVSQQNQGQSIDSPLFSAEDDEPLLSEFSEHNRFQSENQQDGLKTEKDIDRKTLNGTAYRIFKILEWLIESPLSLVEMNARFTSDPLIGKAVSDDSVWLYLNTLKMLGCKIRRPSPKNSFCYELLSHPFGLSLPNERQETLIAAKAYAQRSFDHREMLILDGLLKKIIRHSNVAAPQTCIDALFQQSRSHDLETCSGYLQQLEDGIRSNTLCLIRYSSPLHGEAQFHFLPEILYYEQGVPYVRGESSNRQTPSSLRLDRITFLRASHEHPQIQKTLSERRDYQVRVELRLFTSTPSAWSGLELDMRHGVYAETLLQSHQGHRSYVDVSLRVRDFFFLKQRLLTGTLGFQVLQPQEFRQDIRKTLDRMLHFYPTPDQTARLSPNLT